MFRVFVGWATFFFLTLWQFLERIPKRSSAGTLIVLTVPVSPQALVPGILRNSCHVPVAEPEACLRLTCETAPTSRLPKHGKSPQVLGCILGHQSSFNGPPSGLKYIQHNIFASSVEGGVFHERGPETSIPV